LGDYFEPWTLFYIDVLFIALCRFFHHLSITYVNELSGLFLGELLYKNQSIAQKSGAPDFINIINYHPIFRLDKKHIYNRFRIAHYIHVVHDKYLIPVED
jgi:hypothetical protein